MDTRTAEALEASIEHWKRNAVAPFDDILVGSDWCDLCKVFAQRQIGECNGCPVMEHTGKDLCECSPYDACWTEWSLWRISPKNSDARDRFRAAALREVAFLESLRETE